MYYVAKKCKTAGILTKGFPPDFFEIINDYNWPGIVRELFNTQDSAMASAGEQPVLFPQHLPVNIRTRVARTHIHNSRPEKNEDSYKYFRNKILETGEKLYSTRICQQTRGDVALACRRSRLSKSRLYHILQKYGIPLTDYR